MNSVGERDSTSGSSASIAVSWFHIRKCMSLDFRRQRPHLYALPIASGKARSLRTMSLRPLCTIADSPDPRDFAWRMHLSPFLFLTHGSAETLPLSLHPRRVQPRRYVEGVTELQTAERGCGSRRRSKKGPPRRRNLRRGYNPSFSSLLDRSASLR